MFWTDGRQPQDKTVDTKPLFLWKRKTEQKIPWKPLAQRQCIDITCVRRAEGHETLARPNTTSYFGLCTFLP